MAFAPMRARVCRIRHLLCQVTLTCTTLFDGVRGDGVMPTQVRRRSFVTQSSGEGATTVCARKTRAGTVGPRPRRRCRELAQSFMKWRSSRICAPPPTSEAGGIAVAAQGEAGHPKASSHEQRRRRHNNSPLSASFNTGAFRVWRHVHASSHTITRTPVHPGAPIPRRRPAPTQWGAQTTSDL